jgi:hypothetical protein
MGRAEIGGNDAVDAQPGRSARGEFAAHRCRCAGAMPAAPGRRVRRRQAERAHARRPASRRPPAVSPTRTSLPTLPAGKGTSAPRPPPTRTCTTPRACRRRLSACIGGRRRRHRDSSKEGSVVLSERPTGLVQRALRAGAALERCCCSAMVGSERPVPVQMWRWGGPGLGADVAGTGPVPVQMWRR